MAVAGQVSDLQQSGAAARSPWRCCSGRCMASRLAAEACGSGPVIQHARQIGSVAAGVPRTASREIHRYEAYATQRSRSTHPRPS